MPSNPMRTEREVFADLAEICCRPGYVHAIACICFRDNVILYTEDMKEIDISKMFSSSRLVRTEIDTLFGLMVKSDIDWGLPMQGDLQEYIDTTEKLLDELHQCLSITDLTNEVGKVVFKSFDQGDKWREPIFYNGEAAYIFQYLDLANRKYAADSEWLQANRGFTIECATRVAKAIEGIYEDRFEQICERMQNQHPDEWTALPFFSFSVDEIATKTNLSADIVERVFAAFELPSTDRNETFNALNDFNAVTARPLLRMRGGEFLSLQPYALAEAIYEAPHHWMYQDKKYRPTLSKNRGDFTECFVAERLGLVFGNDCVHLNVDIFRSKSEKVSDVDVLVVWGNRVIIVQAKSKRLTLEARKGNDQAVHSDFQKAVQAAYDQGVACAKSMFDQECRLVATDGREVVLPDGIKEIYIFCVVSDHYPALSFQARQFLKTESIDRVQAPLVMDVFTVDVMTEMLQSPLQFLSYVDRRSNYTEQLIASQELTILGYHMKKNLWVPSDVNMMLLCDEFSAGLDIAMMVRRTGVQGAAMPDGVLHRFWKTTVGRIVKEIESKPNPATIDLGLLLLATDEPTVNGMSEVIAKLADRTRADGQIHDFTCLLKNGAGITFHCTDEPLDVAVPRLRSHCALKKYREKSSQWFGVCINSSNLCVRFGITFDFPWSQDKQMDEAAKDMKDPASIDQVLQMLKED